jgi:predicted porin
LAVRGELVPRLYWGTYVKRTFISAAAILAFAAAAHADELSDIQAQAKQLREQNQAMQKRLAEQNQAMQKRLADLEKRQKELETQKAVAVNPVDALAADLPYKAVKAKPVESDDLCLHGICLYGNFDAGLSWESHGAPSSALAGFPVNALINNNSNHPTFTFTPNQLSTSFLGLRGKQEIADNLYAVFNLQTLFNSANGNNANGLGSIPQNNGLGTNIGLQNAFGDSSKAGQLFNNVAYFGVSSPTWGTLTLGRQSALSSDLIVNYDPLSGSNAWSLITFAGANGGGGATEDRIYDNSIEYRLTVGPVRFAVETQIANGGNSSQGNAFEGDIGFDWEGFSADLTGGKIYNATTAGVFTGSAATGTFPGINPNVAIGLGQVALTTSDNTFAQIGAKYVIGPWKLFAGYEYIQNHNPHTPLFAGAFVLGGYIAGSVNNLAFDSVRIRQTAWFGTRYSITPTLDITGAWYHLWQNDFQNSGSGSNFVNTAAAFGACAFAVASQSSGCAGTFDVVSLVVDWRFARHMDVYAGVAFSEARGGQANGFLLANTTNAGTQQTFPHNSATNVDPGVGLRYQF